MGILVVMPIAAAIALLERKKIEDFFFGAIAIIIFAILISGYIFHNTLPGVYIGLCLGFISLSYCIYIYIIDKGRIIENILTPGLVVMLFFSVLSGILLINKTSLGGENDTYWAHAPQILNMYKNSNIGNVGEVSKNYSLMYTLPVYTSWCYFCNILWGTYSDGINLWARQIFVMAAFMPFFSYMQKKDLKKIVLVCICVILIPGMIGNSYAFMPDIPVAALTIYGTLMIIKLYQTNEEYNDVAYLFIGCLCILYLYCIKRMGGVYTFSILGIATVYTIDRLKGEKRKKSIIFKISPLLVFFISALLATFFFEYRRRKIDDEKLLSLLPIFCFILFLILGAICKIMLNLIYKRNYFILLGLIFSIFLIIPTLIIKFADKYSKYQEEKPLTVFKRFISVWLTNTDRFGNSWKLSDFQYILILFIAVFFVRKMINNNKIKFEF